MWPWRRTLVLAACLFTLGWSLPSGAIAPDDSVAWIVQGRPSALAQSAVQILEQAGDEGLNPSDYDATVLGHSVVAATKGKPLTAEQQTALNAAISQSLLRYLHDLHYGRVDPRSVYANFNVAPKTLNLPATLNAAVAAGDLKQAVKAATPAFPLYQALKPWLARYRALEHNPA